MLWFVHLADALSIDIVAIIKDMQRARQAGRFLVRTVASITAIAVIIAGVRITFAGTPAYASADTYNPSYCLGAWENPRAASGPRELSDGASFNDFGPTNAAFLPQGASSLLFCGYFAIESRERPPEKATLSFVWSLDPSFLDAYREGQPEAVLAAPADIPVHQEGAANEHTPSEATSDTVPANNGVVPEVSESPAEAPATADESAPIPTPTPTTAESAAPPVEVSAPAPVIEAPPPAPPAEAPVSVRDVLKHMAFFLTPIAHAQEVPVADTLPADAPETTEVAADAPAAPFPSEGTAPVDAQEIPAPVETPPATDVMRDAAFVRVSYSFDGANWVPLQAAGTKNWNQFQVEIPAGTWEELQNLQIMLLPLPGDGKRPPLYLDAVELIVEQDLTFTEIAADTVEGALAVIDSAATAIAEVFNTNSSDTQLAAVSEVAGASPNPAPSERTKEVLVYTFAGDPLPVVSRLPWHPEKFSETLPPNSDLPAPQVSIDSTGRELSVRGYCEDAYYVVLTFRNPDDYYGAPQQFASNYAGACEGGSFQYDVTHLPENTPNGTYYLLLARQGRDTPWVPTSKLLPIQIGRAQVVVRADAQ